MGEPEALLDAVLNGLGRTRGRDVFVLNIGAMDGVSFDDMRPYVDRYGWGGLFVEPVPELFERLVRSFGERTGVRFERAAIADEDGEIEMVRIPPDLVDRGQLDLYLLGMSSLLPVRNGFASVRERLLLDRHGERICVPALTLDSLLKTHAVERIDVLQIDVEGYDWSVLRQFDFDRFHPVVIRLESCNLPPGEEAESRALLEAQGYDVLHLREDVCAIARNAMAFDATLVTAAYERRPDDVVGGRGYPLEHYFSSLKSIVRAGSPVVIYTQRRLVPQVTEFFARERGDVRVVARPLSAAPRFWDIEELRIRQGIHTMAHRDRCHVLCLAKAAWLAEQARENPFGTSRFYWIDAGLSYPALFPARHLPRPHGRCDLFSPAMPAALRRAARLAVFELSPIVGRQLHGVDVEAMARIAGAGAKSIATHIVGGLFGGRRDDVLHLHEEYDAVLAEMLAAGLLGTEENILTILYHRDPSRFTTHTFTTWYHEDTDFTQPAAGDVPFYRLFERFAAGSGAAGADEGASVLLEREPFRRANTSRAGETS